MKKAVINIIFLSFIIILFAYLFIPSTMKLAGRPIWHFPKRLIDYELDGEGTSQQVFDIYSFSHITHGVLFYFILQYLGFHYSAIAYWAALIEIIWECFENTPFIINKYRMKKEFKHFKGDSLINIVGDVIFTVLGVYLTYLSPIAAIIFVILSEFVFYPLGANFLYLSLGSLIHPKRKLHHVSFT